MKKTMLMLLLAALLLFPVLTLGAAEPAPLEVTITLDKSTLAVGESIIASWNITGGTPPYKILGIWMVKQAIIDEEYQLTAKVIENTSVMTPIIGESGYLLLIVSDAETSIGYESPVFSITGAEVMEPLAVEISFDKMAIAVGQPITASWTITGGLSPYKVYPQWYIYEENRDGEIFIKGDAVGNSCTLTPTTGLEGCFTLYVANANKWGRAYDSEFFSIMPALDNQGDANGDGGVDIMDLVSIIDYIVSDTKPASMPNADANGDGMVDIMDLVWIIDQIVGG